MPVMLPGQRFRTHVGLRLMTYSYNFFPVMQWVLVSSCCDKVNWYISTISWIDWAFYCKEKVCHSQQQLLNSKITILNQNQNQQTWVHCKSLLAIIHNGWYNITHEVSVRSNGGLFAQDSQKAAGQPKIMMQKDARQPKIMMQLDLWLSRGQP